MSSHPTLPNREAPNREATDRAFNQGLSTLRPNEERLQVNAESRRDTFHSSHSVRSLLFDETRDQPLIGGYFPPQGSLLRRLRFFLFGISFLLASLITAILASN